MTSPVLHGKPAGPGLQGWLADSGGADGCPQGGPGPVEPAGGPNSGVGLGVRGARLMNTISGSTTKSAKLGRG